MAQGTKTFGASAHARLGWRGGVSRRPTAVSHEGDGDVTADDAGADGDGAVEVAAKTKPGRRRGEKPERKPIGELLANLWAELKTSTTPLREDVTPEAVALMALLEAAKSRPPRGASWTETQWQVQEQAAGGVGDATGKYWAAKWDALVNSAAVKDAAPLVTSAVNVAIAGVLLRLALPRVAALQAVGGFDELADFFGLPPRAELSGYLEQLQGGGSGAWGLGSRVEETGVVSVFIISITGIGV